AVPLGVERSSGSRVRFPVSTTRLMFVAAILAAPFRRKLCPRTAAEAYGGRFRESRESSGRPSVDRVGFLTEGAAFRGEAAGRRVSSPGSRRGAAAPAEAPPRPPARRPAARGEGWGEAASRAGRG